jgi:imidazolonepropionase-like amidohydrolase
MVTVGRDYGLPPAVIDLAARKLETHVASFALALKAGIRIASGSDIGSPACAHGTGARELALLVRHGMSPMRAIETATAASATMLGMAADIGTIEPGKFADLVVVDGDPLADIAILQDAARLSSVYKAGRLVARGGASPD